jgi:hypothetical protein
MFTNTALLRSAQNLSLFPLSACPKSKPQEGPAQPLPRKRG